MLNALQLQALLIPEGPESDNTRRLVPFLAIEKCPYRCPSLLPEYELYCLGNQVPPAIPIEYPGQRKVVEQWLWFLLLLHTTTLLELFSAECLLTLKLVQGLRLEPKWQWPF